jgi:hypothetical protein
MDIACHIAHKSLSYMVIQPLGGDPTLCLLYTFLSTTVDDVSVT